MPTNPKANLIFFLLLILGITIMPLYANEALTSHFENAITNFQKTHLLNADMLVAKENQILFRKSVGFADIAQKRPFTENTIFPIASMTKQFMAVAILLLKEENKIDLHLPIVQYLPKEHPLWQGDMPSWANIITCHQLLTHSSGLSNYTDEKIEGLNLEENVISCIISRFKARPLKFKPGSTFEYSNTGYLLLGVILETITQESLSEFLNKRIFKPLGMTQSYLPTVANEMKIIAEFPIQGDVPIPYMADLNNLKQKLMIVKHPFTVPLQGGAAMFSTLQDLLKWNDALYHQKLITKESLTLMTTPLIEVHDPLFGNTHYGYGIFIDNKGSYLLYQHGGWVEGFRAMLSYSPIHKTSVILLSNLSPAENMSEKNISHQITAFNDLAYEIQKISS